MPQQEARRQTVQWRPHRAEQRLLQRRRRRRLWWRRRMCHLTVLSRAFGHLRHRGDVPLHQSNVLLQRPRHLTLLPCATRHLLERRDVPTHQRNVLL